ncbi:MAG: hypothetical protein K6B46_05420, partial [Opitutales bacterium]|nr:hypothetical protein [Opitutales bacterium]
MKNILAFSTLIAAAAGAYAVEYTAPTTLNGSSKLPDAAITAGNTVTFNGSTGFIYQSWYGNGSDSRFNSPFAANAIFTDNGTTAALTWNDGSSSTEPIITFSGAVSGTGTLKAEHATKKQSFIFSGDLSGFSGMFKMSGAT